MRVSVKFCPVAAPPNDLNNFLLFLVFLCFARASISVIINAEKSCNYNTAKLNAED